MSLMMPIPLAADVARAHEADLRGAADRSRLACRGEGIFTSLVARVRADIERVQLGPSAVVVCPC